MAQFSPARAAVFTLLMISAAVCLFVTDFAAAAVDASADDNAKTKTNVEGHMYHYRIYMQLSETKTAESDDHRMPAEEATTTITARHSLGVNILLHPVWRSANENEIVIKAQLDSTDPALPTGLEFPFYFVIDKKLDGEQISAIWLHKHDRQISSNIKRGLVNLINNKHGTDDGHQQQQSSLFKNSKDAEFLQFRAKRQREAHLVRAFLPLPPPQLTFLQHLNSTRLETVDTLHSAVLLSSRFSYAMQINCTQVLQYRGPVGEKLSLAETYTTQQYKTLKLLGEHELSEFYEQESTSSPSFVPLPQSLDALVEENNSTSNLTSFIRQKLQQKKFSVKSATFGAVKLFSQLVERVKFTDKAVVLSELQTLYSKKTGNQKLLVMLLDAIAACQQLPAFNAAQEFLLQKLQPASAAHQLRKRFYMSLLFVSKPNAKILQALSTTLNDVYGKNDAESGELEELLALTVGAMLGATTSETDESIIKQLRSSLQSAVTVSTNERGDGVGTAEQQQQQKERRVSIYARALANARQPQDAVQLLRLLHSTNSREADVGGGGVSRRNAVVIIQASGSVLQTMDTQTLAKLLLTSEQEENNTVQILIDVLLSKTFDTSARVQALETCLWLAVHSHQQEEEGGGSSFPQQVAHAMVAVLRSYGDGEKQRPNRELIKFITSRISDMVRGEQQQRPQRSSSTTKFLAIFFSVLHAQNFVPATENAAQILLLPLLLRAGSGKAKSFTFRGQLAQFNSSSNSDVEFDMGVEMDSGMLKSSFVHVTMQSPPTLWKDFIKFNVFTSGLESIAGSKEDNDDHGDDNDDDGAIGGVMVTLLGRAVPTQIFFEGMSGLMSLAWSAQADTPLAQNELNLRHVHAQQEFSTPSGLAVRLMATVDVSIDIAGYLDLSLWNQYSKTTVQNRASVRVELAASVPFNSLNVNTLRVNQIDSVEAQMDFRTVVDFGASPLLYCMQMHYNDLTYRHACRGGVEERKSKREKVWRQKAKRAKRALLPGKSFFLGEANAAQCKRLKKLL